MFLSLRHSNGARDFDLESLEVWAVGPPPEEDNAPGGGNKKGVRGEDRFREEKFLMQVARMDAGPAREER